MALWVLRNRQDQIRKIEGEPRKNDGPIARTYKVHIKRRVVQSSRDNKPKRLKQPIFMSCSSVVDFKYFDGPQLDLKNKMIIYV